MTVSVKRIAAAALASFVLNSGALAAGPPPTGGTVSIEAKTADDSPDATMPLFVDAASAALTARGFTVFADSGHAASVIELILAHGDVGTGVGKVPGQKAASIAGTGVAVPLGTGNSALVRLQRTRLELRIHRRGDSAIVWDGTAVTVREAGVATGSDATVASDLIRALLDTYPAQPTGVVGVP